MDNTIPTSPTHHEWMDHDDIPYYYYKQPDFAIENNPHECFSDSTIITTNTQNMTIDHQYSSQISGNDDIHESINPKTKPVIRRKFRASKKTPPTTLLNASITNFRALVQQHTGCHTSPMFNNQKGPINLSFGPPNDHQNELFGSNSVEEGYNRNYGYYYNYEDQAENYTKDNLQQEKQESGGTSASYSINSENSKLSVDDYGW